MIKDAARIAFGFRNLENDATAIYEVRVQGGGANHRLFCLLDRDAEDLGGSSIICIDHLSPVVAALVPESS